MPSRIIFFEIVAFTAVGELMKSVYLLSVILMLLCSSTFASTSQCSVTAKCAIGESTCSASVSGNEANHHEATCSNEGKFLSCKEKWFNTSRKDWYSEANYVCCNTDGAAFTTTDSFLAGQNCVGH